MPGEIKRIFEAFQDNGLEDPLAETLAVLDIASGGAMSRADVSCIDPDKVDFAQLAAERKAGVP